MFDYLCLNWNKILVPPLHTVVSECCHTQSWQQEKEYSSEVWMKILNSGLKKSWRIAKWTDLIVFWKVKSCCLTRQTYKHTKLSPIVLSRKSHLQMHYNEWQIGYYLLANIAIEIYQMNILPPKITELITIPQRQFLIFSSAFRY